MHFLTTKEMARTLSVAKNITEFEHHFLRRPKEVIHNLLSLSFSKYSCFERKPAPEDGLFSEPWNEDFNKILARINPEPGFTLFVKMHRNFWYHR